MLVQTVILVLSIYRHGFVCDARVYKNEIEEKNNVYIKKKIEETNKVKSPPRVDFHLNERQAFIWFDVWQAVARKKNQPVSTVCCSCLLNPQTSLAYTV